MTTDPVVTTEWNDDRTELTVSVETAAGIRTSIYGWADPETAAKHADLAIAFAVDKADVVIPEPGQKNNTRRVGRFLVSHMSGPPTWWWPRVSVRRGLMVGWLRHAFAITLSKRERGAS